MSQQQAIIGKEPCFGLSYGDSGLGKTTDLCYAMPRAFFFATPAALKPAAHVCGYNIGTNQVWEPDRVSSMTKMLAKLGNDFDGVVVDDMSLVVERTLSILEKRKWQNKYELWTTLGDEVREFRDAARACKKHVLMNAHARPPRMTQTGKYIKGGPKFPMDLAETVPVQCDLVLRAFVEPSRKGPWKVVYRCNVTDTEYVSKDRCNVTPDYAPMNTGEILRLAGYELRRAPGLEWLDEWVERIAQAAMQTDPAQHPALMQQIITAMAQQVTQNQLHIRWALRDGFDRATLRHARANILAGFFS